MAWNAVVQWRNGKGGYVAVSPTPLKPLYLTRRKRLLSEWVVCLTGPDGLYAELGTQRDARLLAEYHAQLLFGPPD